MLHPTPSLGPDVERAQILKAAATSGVLGPGVQGAQRILAALCNPALPSRELVRLVGQQPGLYARVLRVANSAYYGRMRSVTTIDRALVLLGLDAVRGIVAAACLDRAMGRSGAGSPVDMSAMLRHSLATAAAAESLARRCRPALAAEAFIAGLLHNLGIVVQLLVDAPGIDALIGKRKADSTADMRALEAEYCTVGHELCAATLFESWQLPEVLVAAARHHHAPMAAGEAHRDLAALVNLGANLALAGGSTFTLEPAPVAREDTAMAWLGASHPQLDELGLELPARVLDLQRALLDG